MPWTPWHIERLQRATRSPRHWHARKPTATGPDRTGAVEVRETHMCWAFLTGDRAYKLKAPGTLPFVDYGTAARRRAMCEEEVRLDRRLAPDVYLGTRVVIPTAEGVVLAGSAITLLTHRGVVRAGTRQLVIGLAAAAVSVAIGWLVGVEDRPGVSSPRLPLNAHGT